MKKALVLTMACFVAFAMNAQRFDVGLNVMTAMPMYNGKFGTSNIEEGFGIFTGKPGFGTGAGIEANYWFNDNISAGLEVGFISFGKASGTIDPGIGFGFTVPLKSSASAIPLMIKAQYYFLDDVFRPFAGLGIGYTIWGNTQNIDASSLGGRNVELTWNQNGLLISPRAGLLYQATDAISLNLSIQYNIMMNKIDKVDTDITISQTGEPTETNAIKEWESNATNYLGINLGLVYTLFD